LKPRHAMNLYSLTRRFPTEKDALDHLVKTRWPRGVRCVACDHGKCWPIESTNIANLSRRGMDTFSEVASTDGFA
jgi:hypothetical protein